MRFRMATLILLAATLGLLPPALAAQSDSIDELYKKALSEEGVLNCYCSLAQINAEKIYPLFEKRFPGIRINHEKIKEMFLYVKNFSRPPPPYFGRQSIYTHGNRTPGGRKWLFGDFLIKFSKIQDFRVNTPTNSNEVETPSR